MTDSDWIKVIAATEDPEERSVHLGVWADWLEENGFPHRGLAVRHIRMRDIYPAHDAGGDFVWVSDVVSPAWEKMSHSRLPHVILCLLDCSPSLMVRPWHLPADDDMWPKDGRHPIMKRRWMSYLSLEIAWRCAVDAWETALKAESLSARSEGSQSQVAEAGR